MFFQSWRDHLQKDNLRNSLLHAKLTTALLISNSLLRYSSTNKVAVWYDFYFFLLIFQTIPKRGIWKKAWRNKAQPALGSALQFSSSHTFFVFFYDFLFYWSLLLVEGCNIIHGLTIKCEYWKLLCRLPNFHLDARDYLYFLH